MLSSGISVEGDSYDLREQKWVAGTTHVVEAWFEETGGVLAAVFDG